MRGSWTPLLAKLTRSPKMRELARELKCDFDSALGAAVRWIMFTEEQFHDSPETHMTPQEMDDELRRSGLTRGLQKIGWVSVQYGYVVVQEHRKHATEKVLAALRQARFRNSQDAAITADRSPERVGADAQPDGAPLGSSAPPVVTQKVTPKVTREVTRGITPNACALPQAHAVEGSNKNSLRQRAVNSTNPVPAQGLNWNPQRVEFVKQLAMAHPALRNMQRYPQDVMDAFDLAFEMRPDAPQYVELLCAFYAANLTIYPRTHFWRPTSASRFLRDIAEVIESAQTWAKLDHWKPLAVRRKLKEQAAARAPKQEIISEQQRQENIAAWDEQAKQITQRNQS